MPKKKILIAAGGTGGHIYPALAIADALKEAGDVEIAFVGTESGLENKLIPPKGYVVHHLPIGRLNGVSRRERFTTLLRLPWSLVVSWRLLRRERPALTLGVGGHASGPLLLVASRLGLPTAIWEPNAMPGLANRVLARFVDECWVVFPEARRLLKNSKAETAGMPVRREVEAIGAAARTDAALGGGRPFRILVFGGSQGARGVNTTVADMVRAGGEWLKDIRIVHQTGAADFARVRDLYGPGLASGEYPVDLREYLHDMGAQYAEADLVVCRSGTGTLSELAACGKPSILIPFPFASDDHQRKNAESLVAKGAAVMIVQKDLTAEGLRIEIERLRQDAGARRLMSERITRFHVPRAAETLATRFLERMDHDATV